MMLQVYSVETNLPPRTPRPPRKDEEGGGTPHYVLFRGQRLSHQPLFVFGFPFDSLGVLGALGGEPPLLQKS